jgi:hypothetical protein
MSYKKLFLSTIIILVLSSYPLISSAGASSEMWSRTYGGTESDSAEAMIQTSDGGYALVGYTNSFGAGGYDFWLVKTDAYGNMEWNKTYGGEGNEQAYALVETSDGGYALAGLTKSFGDGDDDFWLVKTDEYGNMEWTITHGSGEGIDIAYALVQTSDGGYALAGSTTTFSVGEKKMWLVKTDANGSMEWNIRYGMDLGSEAHALVQTSDGGYALAGIYETELWGIESWLIKTHANGTTNWQKTFRGDGREVLHALVETSDGGLILAGETDSFAGAVDNDGWLTKINPSGGIEWSYSYGGIDTDLFSSLVVTSDGGYAITGATGSFGAGQNDSWLVKTDVYGNVEWNQTYGGADLEWAHCLVETSDGGLALAGYTESFGAGGLDFWLVKTDEYGVIPEFSSWIFLTLFIAVPFVIVMFYRMQRKKEIIKEPKTSIL